MDGGEDQAVGVEMAAHLVCEGRAPAGVQRGHRLVQQPQGARRSDQPAHGQAAALAGGQAADFKVQQGGEAESLDRIVHAALDMTQPVALEAQFFARRSAGLQSVLVTEEMGFAAARQPFVQRIAVAVMEGDLSRIRPQQAGDGAQQTGLACAIGARQHHGFAGLEAQVETLEQTTLAA